MHLRVCLGGVCVCVCCVRVCLCVFVCLYVYVSELELMVYRGIQRYTKYTLKRFFEKWYALLLASLILEVLDSLSADRFM